MAKRCEFSDADVMYKLVVPNHESLHPELESGLVGPGRVEVFIFCTAVSDFQATYRSRNDVSTLRLLIMFGEIFLNQTSPTKRLRIEVCQPGSDGSYGKDHCYCPLDFFDESEAGASSF